MEEVDLTGDDGLDPEERQALAGTITVLLEALERFSKRSGLPMRTEILQDLPDDVWDELQRIRAFVRAGFPLLE